MFVCRPRLELPILNHTHTHTSTTLLHKPLTPEEMAQADIAGLIARELARMHSMQVTIADEGNDGGGNCKRTAVLWDKMGQWARLAEGE